MAKLLIGKDQGSEDFWLPEDSVARTFAIIGQRGSGKSSTACVMAEEMCKAGLPWIALDPVGVWWGLRSKADGQAGGFPVVVFGGERGDLPLEKGQGRKIAEACVAANVFAVIDLSRDSKTTWRTIVRDFCHTLQELRPGEPRHVFLEEAPEFVPQRASHQLGAECKEIVERLVRLGRNWGYGATVLSQRPATVDKDVLSQCESLFVMRTSGAHDRKALQEWIEAHDTGNIDVALDSLATLPDGSGWLWSPQWLKCFAKIAVRRRETFHPGATRTVGKKAGPVEMVDVDAFVAKVRKELTKTVVTACPVPKDPKTVKTLLTAAGIAAAGGGPLIRKMEQEAEELKRDLELKDAAIDRLDEELKVERARVADMALRLHAVRQIFKPQHEALQKLFGEFGQAEASAATGEVSQAWAPWLSKAGTVGCKGMLEILIRKGRCKQVQLATLAGVKFGGSTWRAYRSWITRNHLATLQGDEIEAARL